MTKNKELTIEGIKEIIKKEFRRNLYEGRPGVYISKSDLVYVSLNYSRIYVSLQCEKKGYVSELEKVGITTEKELLDLIKKFKKSRKML